MKQATARIFKSEMLLLLASIIWGFAFVAQRVGMRYVGPFTFNGVRFALGGLVLLPFLLAGRNGGRRDGSEPRGPSPGAEVVIRYGIVAGTVLFAGASLQQVGIVYTTAGKAGFITGLYVVLVPILGLFLNQRPGAGVWMGAASAAAGLYLLSVKGRFSFAGGDLLVLASAFFFAVHVLLIGWMSSRVAVRKLAFTQFTVCALLSLAVALAAERITLETLEVAAVPILYGGVLSVGVAYTLQVAGQRYAPPSPAAIILSLEAVFAALGGWILLHEGLSPRAIVGCALMLAGMVGAQLSSRSSALDA